MQGIEETICYKAWVDGSVSQGNSGREERSRGLKWGQKIQFRSLCEFILDD
jgi:hypothetical protein